MAKKSKIAKYHKQLELIERYADLRRELKAKGDYEGLRKLPLDSNPNRLKLRDRIDGRPTPICASLALAGSTSAIWPIRENCRGSKKPAGREWSFHFFFAIIISVDGGGKMALDLDVIRKDIDQVDEEIVALLEKRMDLVSQVVAYKKESGKAILDTGREQAVLERVQSLVNNPDYKTTIRDSFADLMAQSRAYQKERLDD